MDAVLKIYNEIVDSSKAFVDLCLSKHKDFKSLSDDVQNTVRVFCVSVLVTQQWIALCERINK